MELGLDFCVDDGPRIPDLLVTWPLVGLGHGLFLLRRLPVGGRVDEATSKQSVRMTKLSVVLSLFMRSRSSCEDQFCVTGDRFVAGFAHQVTADAGAEFEAFNAYAEWCKGQAHDDGHQQEILAHLSWSALHRLQLYFTPRQHR